MKVIVNIPLRGTIEYIDDFIEESIPDIGDRFDENYIIKTKNIEGNICTLNLVSG